MLQLEAERDDWESRNPYKATQLKGNATDTGKEPLSEEKVTTDQEGYDKDRTEDKVEENALAHHPFYEVLEPLDIDLQMRESIGDKWWFKAIEVLNNKWYEKDATLFYEGNTNVYIHDFPHLTSIPGLKFLQNMPSTIIMLELRKCGLDSKSIGEGLFFSECFSLESLSLAENNLTSVPFFLDKMKHLKFLDLSHNLLSHRLQTQVGVSEEDEGPSTWTDKTPLTLADALQMQADNSTESNISISLGAMRNTGRLMYLNLTGNESLCSLPYYRDMIIATLPSLKALDGHIVCDEEVYSVLFGRHKLFPAPFCAGHKQYRVPPSFMSAGPDLDMDAHKELEMDKADSVKRKAGMRKQGDNVLLVPVMPDRNISRLVQVRTYLAAKASKLEQQYRMTSPVVRIQRCIRSWIRWIRMKPIRVFAKLARLQARVRRFLFLQRCKKDLKVVMEQAGEWDPVLDEAMISNQHSMKGNDKEDIDAKEKLRNDYNLQVHARTIAQFMFRSIAKKRRSRAGAKIVLWAGRIVRGWARDLEFLDQVKEVNGLVVPAGMEEQVLDVLTYFERRYVARREGGGEEEAMTYMAEELSDVALLRIPKGVREMKATRARLSAQGRQMTDLHGLARWCFHPASRDGASQATPALHGMWRILKGIDERQSLSLRLIKRRGCREIKQSLLARLKTARLGPTHRTPLVLIPVPVHRMVVLRDAIRYIRNPRNYYYRDLATHIFFDVDVDDAVNATRLQALFRGVRTRHVKRSYFAQKVLRRRSTILIQRWWRYNNGLLRRLRLLRDVCAACAAITEPVFYLDLWSFYWLLRQRRLPELSPSLHKFPELRGTPHVTAKGRAVIKPFVDDAKWQLNPRDTEGPLLHDKAKALPRQEEKGRSEDHSHKESRGKGNAKNARNDPDKMEFSSWGVQKQIRNFNNKELLRFGVPLWIPYRPASEEFYSSRFNDTVHHNRATYQEEYMLHTRRQEPLYPFYDLVSMGLEVRVRPVLCPRDRQHGGYEPKSRRWYEEGLEHAASDADADLRVVEISCPSLAEARARAMVLMLSTYDHLTRTCVEPMNERTVLDALWENRISIQRKKKVMLAELNTEQTPTSSSHVPSASASNVREVSTSGSSLRVVAPIEVSVNLQASALPGWISRMQYAVWDVMRFRFLCHTLVVISNSNVLVSETTQAKEPYPLTSISPAVLTEEEERKRESARVARWRRHEMELLKGVPQHSLLSYSDSIFSVREFGLNTNASVKNKETREKSGERDEVETAACGSQDEGEDKDNELSATSGAPVEQPPGRASFGAENSLASMEGVPMPQDLFNQMLDVHSHLEGSEASFRGVGAELQQVASQVPIEGQGSMSQSDSGHLALMSSGGGAGSSVTGLHDMYADFDPHSNPFRKKSQGVDSDGTASFLAKKIVTGNSWSPRESDAAYTQSEQEQERNALEAVFEHSSDLRETLRYTEGVDTLLEHAASLDGFESGSVTQEATRDKLKALLESGRGEEAVHVSRALERQYETFKRQSPPSCHQLRQVGIYTAIDGVYGTEDHLPSSISSPFRRRYENVEYFHADRGAAAPQSQSEGKGSPLLPRSGGLATTASAGAGHGSNAYHIQRHAAADLSTRWQATAALSYLRSNVWDVNRIMMWCSRGLDHSHTAEEKQRDRMPLSDSTEDFRHVVMTQSQPLSKASRYFVPVRASRGGEKGRGMNEQKALVARLEALQLGLYEYAMRLSKLEKINSMPPPATSARARDSQRGGSQISPSPSLGKGLTPAAAVAHQAALHQAYYAGQGIDSSQGPQNPLFPYSKPHASAEERQVHTVPGLKALEEVAAGGRVTLPGQEVSSTCGADRDRVPSPRSSLAGEDTTLLLMQSRARSVSPEPARHSRSLVSPVTDEASEKSKDKKGRREPSPASQRGDSPAMFDDSITLTVYETSQQHRSHEDPPSPSPSPTGLIVVPEDDREKKLSVHHPTVKSLGGSSISPVRPGSAVVDSTPTIGDSGVDSIISPRSGVRGEGPTTENIPFKMSVAAKPLNSPTTFRPVSEELKLAATAQEERERLVLEKGASAAGISLSATVDAKQEHSVEDKCSGELPKLWKGSLKATEYAKYTEKAKKNRDVHKHSLKERRKVMRRNRAISSHIRNVQRDESQVIRMFQRDMRLLQVARPQSTSGQDWHRPTTSGYSAGNVYASHLEAGMAADVDGNLGFQSKDTSMATLSVAVRQSEATLDVEEGRPPATKVSVRRTPAHTRPGKSVRRGSPPVSRSPRPPNSPRNQQKQPADVPDLDFVRNLERVYKEKNSEVAPSVPHTAFNPFPSTARSSGRWDRATPRTTLASSHNLDGAYRKDGDNDSADMDIQELSGSVQSLGFRLELDPNYADLLAEPAPDKRYGKITPQSGLMNHNDVAGNKDAGGRVSSSEHAQQSFINSLLANAKAKRLATFDTRVASAGAGATRTGSAPTSEQHVPHRSGTGGNQKRRERVPAGTDSYRAREGRSVDLASMGTMDLTVTPAHSLASVVSHPQQGRGKKGKGPVREATGEDNGLGGMDINGQAVGLRADSPLLAPAPEMKQKGRGFLPRI